MKRFASIAVFLCVFAFAPLRADAAPAHASREEAQAMCEKAAELIKTEGLEKAVAKFQDKNGGFMDRDLYVFMLDDKGVFVAHGAKPVLIGKGGMDMKDVNGFGFIKAFIDVKDKAWVDYKWPDITDNNKIKAKSTYIIRVGGHVVGVGYFKED